MDESRRTFEILGTSLGVEDGRFDKGGRSLGIALGRPDAVGSIDGWQDGIGLAERRRESRALGIADELTSVGMHVEN